MSCPACEGIDLDNGWCPDCGDSEIVRRGGVKALQASRDEWKRRTFQHAEDVDRFRGFVPGAKAVEAIRALIEYDTAPIYRKFPRDYASRVLDTLREHWPQEWGEWPGC